MNAFFLRPPTGGPATSPWALAPTLWATPSRPEGLGGGFKFPARFLPGMNARASSEPGSSRPFLGQDFFLRPPLGGPATSPWALAPVLWATPSRPEGLGGGLRFPARVLPGMNARSSSEPGSSRPFLGQDFFLRPPLGGPATSPWASAPALWATPSRPEGLGGGLRFPARFLPGMNARSSSEPGSSRPS